MKKLIAILRANIYVTFHWSTYIILGHNGHGLDFIGIQDIRYPHKWTKIYYNNGRCCKFTKLL